MTQPREISFSFPIGSPATFCASETEHADDDALVHVDWCTFPDFLICGSERKLVGLSFPVIVGLEAFVKEMVSRSHPDLAMYVDTRSTPAPSRYEGAGLMARLEIYWRKTEGEVQCECASWDGGHWFFSPAAEPELGIEIPSAFFLPDLEYTLSVNRFSL